MTSIDDNGIHFTLKKYTIDHYGKVTILAGDMDLFHAKKSARFSDSNGQLSPVVTANRYASTSG
jgi:hypothetical protein